MNLNRNALLAGLIIISVECRHIYRRGLRHVPIERHLALTSSKVASQERRTKASDAVSRRKGGSKGENDTTEPCSNTQGKGVGSKVRKNSGKRSDRDKILDYSFNPCDDIVDDINYCSQISDCTDTQWCAPTEEDNVLVCKEYAAEGGSCEGYTLPQNFNECNPATHYCYTPKSCLVPDLPGTCELKDSHRFKLGDCCSVDDDCESNKCGKGETFNTCVDLVTDDSIEKDKIKCALETSGGCEACASTQLSNGTYCLWFGEMETPVCAPVSEGDMGAGHEICAIVDDKDKEICAAQNDEGCESCATTQISGGKYCLWFGQMETPVCAPVSEGGMGEGHNMCAIVDDKDKEICAAQNNEGCESCATTQISGGKHCLWFGEMETPVCAPVSEGGMGEGHNMCAIVSSPTTINIASNDIGNPNYVLNFLQ